jgi:tetratricopeptide (TPR) repeat protein
VSEAVQYAEAAGDKAVAVSALDRAQLQYSAALTALDPDSSRENYQRWLSIAQRLGLAGVFDPSTNHLKFLERAVALASARNDQRALVRAEYWVGYINYSLGDSPAAIRILESALAGAINVGDEPLAVQLRATIGQASAAAGQYEKALSFLDEAIPIKRQFRKSGQPAVALAYSLACKGSVLGDRGLFPQAHACFDEALAAVRNSGHEVEASVLLWQSAVCLWQGRWEHAQVSAIEAKQVSERVKGLYLYSRSLSISGYASWMLQRSQKSLQTIMDATSWLETHNRQLFNSLGHGWVAECLVESERWQEARHHAARALVRSRQHDHLGAAMAHRAMARASAMGYNRKPPEYYLSLAMENARFRGARHEIAVTLLCEAEIRANRGESARAIELTDQSESLFEELAMPWHLEAARKLRRRC